jgi:sugar phosphate isomerase/epimerase
MKLAFTTLGCPEWRIEDIPGRAKAYGFDGVELRVADDGVHLRPDASADEVKRVADRFAGAGVPIFALCGYASYSSAERKQVQANQALTRRLIEIAAGLGARAVRSYGGKFEKTQDRAAVAARIAAALRPLADEAHGRGVTIALETHSWWARGDDMAAIIEQVGRPGSAGAKPGSAGAKPGVGVLFDVNNTFADTGEWRQTYQRIRPHIVYCHLKDGYKGADGRGHHVMLGAGDLPLQEVLAQLKGDGFAGYLSFEWEKRWEPALAPPEEVFPQYVHKVRRVWDAV